jgi:hypothetical protein
MNETIIAQFLIYFKFLFSANFVLFWAFPIAFMGMLWKYCLKYFLLPVYNIIDDNSVLRDFASKYVYAKQTGVDLFATSLLTILNSSISLSVVFYWQYKHGYLPWYIIAAYYCSWVGIGGRMMGAAYALAHKEVTSFFISNRFSVYAFQMILSVSNKTIFLGSQPRFI